MTLGGVFRVHCIFLYMEGVAVLNMQIAIKFRKKILIVINIVRCCCQGLGYMSKKGNSDVCTEKNGRKMIKILRKIQMVYITRHCIQGPYQGPLYISQKGNLIWSDEKVKKNKIQMIFQVRVHLMGGGHMTNCPKW